MDENEEVVASVRKTRSGRAVRSPAASAAATKVKASPKPGPRKTRKKVVMVEVEVTDEEDNAVQNADEEATRDVNEEEAQEKDVDSAATEAAKEDSLLNSSTDSDIKRNGNQKDDISASLVLNDIEMLEEITETNEEETTEIPQKDKKMEISEPMEVDVDEKSSEQSVPEKKDIELDITEKDEINNISNKKGESPVKSSVVIETIEIPDNDDVVMVEVDKEKVDTKAKVEIKAKAKIEETKADKEKVSAEIEENKTDKQKDKIEENISVASIEIVGGKDEKKVLQVVEGNKDVKQVPKVVDDNEDVKKVPKVVDGNEDVKKMPEVVDATEDVKEVPKVADGNEDVKQVPKAVDGNEVKEVPKVVDGNEDVKEVLKVVENDKHEKKVLKVVEGDKDEEEVSKVVEGDKDEKKVAKAVEVENEVHTVDDGEDDKSEPMDTKEATSDDKETAQQNGDPDAENISEDELPGVPVAKVPETEEVSDEELPGPKRAELPADTEVVSEDELPTVKKESEDELPPKKEGIKRKLSEGDYDPDSPTSENEAPSKKPSLDTSDKEKDKEEKPAKPKKLPELDKYWKAVNDDPTDFTGWTYLLQYVDQENDMEAAREAYDAFLSHYPYCYGYWRKYADYEKRKGNKKKCEEVFERGLKAIPLSVDLWIHYLTYVKSSKPDDEDYIRSQFERALTACGLEFRSDRLWDSYIKWETEGKRLQKVTAIYDRLLATPTQGYTSHFDNFQEHISSNPPNKVIEVDEFLALRKEVRNMLKQDAASAENPAENADIPPGDEEVRISTDEETKCIKERIVSIRRKTHKNTVNAVTARWNYEEGIKRPYFHVKPLERCQLKNWQDYLDYEIEQGDRVRIIVLFERCLIACALYEEFWLKFVHYLETLKDAEILPKIRDVYERACTIHHLKKPNLHLQWAMFEESVDNASRAAEILVNLEKSVPNVLQVAYRRINLERRRGDFEKCAQLYEHYINNSKNKMISSNIAIKYSRFCHKVTKELEKAQEVLKLAITKDPNNPRLYLQLIDLTLQKDNVTEEEVCALFDEFLEKESADPDQKVLFAQRKLEYLEDFGSSIKSVQTAFEQYQKYIKLSKDSIKKKEPKSESTSSSKKEKPAPPSSSQPGSYNNYNYTSSSQPTYPYSGSTQGQYNYSGYQATGDQYQYQNWQYPQGGYGGYNQWGGYGSGYGY